MTEHELQAQNEEPAEIYCFPWRGRLYKDGRVDWYERDPDFGDPNRVMSEAMRQRAQP